MWQSLVCSTSFIDAPSPGLRARLSQWESDLFTRCIATLRRFSIQSGRSANLIWKSEPVRLTQLCSTDDSGAKSTKVFVGVTQLFDHFLAHFFDRLVSTCNQRSGFCLTSRQPLS